MLEGPLKSWISHFLGQYVESQSLQLSTKLWSVSEELELVNLTLKSSIIPGWLPFQLKAGFIGQLNINVPISALFGKGSAKLVFTDVLIVLKQPVYNQDERNQEIENLKSEKANDLKQDILQRWFGPDQSNCDVPIEHEGYFGTDGWIGRTLTKLIDNLQVEIRNFHIRIEGFYSVNAGSTAFMDDFHSIIRSENISSMYSERNTQKQFAIGISLGALSAVTTDSKWRVGRDFDDKKSSSDSSGGNDDDEQKERLFKLLSVLDLSLYLDPNSIHFVHSSIHPRVMQSTLSRLKGMGSSRPAQMDERWSSTAFFEWWNFEQNARLHRFIIAPFSATLKLEIKSAFPSSTNTEPRYTALFYLSRLNCAIDEEQLSICGLIMDTFNTHDEWRHDIRKQIVAEERRNPHANRDDVQSIEKEYLVFWEKILSARVTQPDHFHQIEKSIAWRNLVKFERDLPVSYIGVLRNRGSYEYVMKKACLSERIVRPDIGSSEDIYRGTLDAAPIEIHAHFPRGQTGLVLTYHRSSQELIVVATKEDSTATKNRIKPRSRLIKLNGESILEKCSAHTGMDYLQWLDELDMDIKILTFHLPPKEEAESVPSNIASRISFHTAKLKFSIISAANTIPIVRCVLYDAALNMVGVGDSLFSYHQYDLEIGSFLLQNMSVRNGFWQQDDPLVSYCILSSVRRSQQAVIHSLQDAEKNSQGACVTNTSCSLHLGVDFVHKSHPDVKNGSYGVKYLTHLGDVVLVFDEEKILQLLSALHFFQHGILAPEKTRPAHNFNGDRRNDLEIYSDRCSHGKACGSACLSSASTTDSSGRTNVEAGFPRLDTEDKKPKTRKVIRTTFDVQLGHIRMYICGKDIEISEDGLDSHENHEACSSNNSFDCTENDTHTALVSREASYWNVLHQLAPNDDHEIKAGAETRSHDLNIFPRDWIQYNEAVVNVQRHIRGFLVRKLPIPQMILKTHSSMKRGGYAKFGWLYKRDDTLTFCRWQRYWCYLDPDGHFSVYQNGSGVSLVTRFSVAKCSTTIMRNGIGPWGLPCQLKKNGTPILEISNANRQLLGVFSDKQMAVLEEWNEAVEKMSEHLKDRVAYSSLIASVDYDEVHDRLISTKEDAFSSAHSPFSSIGDMMRGFDFFLKSGFSDTYTKSKELQKMHTKWLVLDLINIVVICDICSENARDHSSFESNLTAQSMTLLDYRRFDIGRPAVFHIGDEFLSFQNNTFLPSRVTLNPYFVTKNTHFLFNVTYGSLLRDTDDFHVDQKRASVKISLAGWIMPFTILSSIMDITAALSVLWRENALDTYTNGTIRYRVDYNERNLELAESRDTMDRAPSSTPARISVQGETKSPVTESLGGNTLLNVTELSIQIQAPMLEAYIEDIDCVVKLTLEKAVCSLRAGSYAEKLTIYLGPTALYLLTNEMALRLVQLNKFYVEYELTVWRQAQETWSSASFAKRSNRKEKRWKLWEEKSKRPLCYRFLDIRIGQVKLEADRRLQLLFALIEALTQPRTNEDLDDSVPWKDEENYQEEHLSLDERQSTQTNKIRSGRRSKRAFETPPTLFSSILDDDNDPFRTGSGLVDSHLLDQLTYPPSGFARSERTLRPGFPLSFTRIKDSGSSPNLRRSFEFSPHIRKKFSFGSNHNAPTSRANSEFQHERLPTRCNEMMLRPLLSYQTYIVIVEDKTRSYGAEKCHFMPIKGVSSSSSRKWAHASTGLGFKSTGKPFIYGLKLRKGRVYDCIFFHCDAIILEVIKRSLSIVALDTYIPVMNFELRDINAEILTNSELSDDYGVSASIGMCAQYYNNALADWEPFIEPWRLNAHLRKHYEPSNRTKGFDVKAQDPGNGIEENARTTQYLETSICLSAMERLNINFTHALVCLLCSVAKNRQKQVYVVEKRKPAAVAADSEARKQDGRVCVLNNLGVPIRLANLNTSRRGSLCIEVRDGWAFPSYSRFHNIRMEVVLLPWWSPRQGETLEQLRHVFVLPYCGAQSGVTPILRIAVSTAVDEKTITNAKTSEDDTDPLPDPFSMVKEDYEVEGKGWWDAAEMKSLDDSGEHWVEERGSDQQSRKNVEMKYWQLLGVAEVNLAATVMGYGTLAEQMSLTRWFRLHDARGTPTGEVLLYLKFIPTDTPEPGKSDFKDPKVVKDGQFLVFDPLKMVSVGHRTQETCTDSSDPTDIVTEPESVQDEEKASQLQHVILADSLRGAYIPPLALEILLDNKRYNLLCPLRRAGKFLIQSDNLTAEVKVAQRDETRRVLLLNSPVQLKNGILRVSYSVRRLTNAYAAETQANAVFWTKKLDRKTPESKDLLPENDENAIYLKANSKISVPLSALHGDTKHSIIMSVNNCIPRVIADLDNLVPGTLLLYWSAGNDEERPSSEIKDNGESYHRRNSSFSHSKGFSESSGTSQLWGYCFLVTIASHTRKVYREDQQTLPANECSNMIYRPKQDKSDYPAKFYRNEDTTAPHKCEESYPGWSEVDPQSYATKHQISLHACLIFENTLPIRVQFKVVLEKTAQREEILIRTGTLSPGKSVRIYEFKKNAQLLLRLPEMDTIWTKPILLAECIYRESSMREQERNLLGLPKVSVKPRAVRPVAVASSAAAAVLTSVQRKISQHDRVIEFYPKAPTLNMMFEKEEMEAKKVITRMDFTQSDNQSPRIVLYASIWIYNQSHMSTLMFRDANDSSSSSTVVHAPQIVPEHPNPRLMDCPSHSFEMNTRVDHEVAGWSDKLHSAVVGVQAPITFEFGRLDLRRNKKRFEVGVSIERPLGQFHRTTKVLVAPRFVFVNQTEVTFKISQTCKENDSNVVEVEPCYKYFVDSATHTMDPFLAAGSMSSPSLASASQSVRERGGYEDIEHLSGGPVVWTPFDFVHSESITQTRKRRVFIKMAHATAHWSGPFAIDHEKEFPLRLRGGVAPNWSSTMSWTRNNKDKDDLLTKFKLSPGAFAQYRLRIRITTVGATMVITLMKDDPPMFFIRNESTLELHVSQARASESSIMLQSGQYVPFAWDRPEGTTRVSCRVSSPKTRAFGLEWNRTSVEVPRLFDFENLDREKGIVELTRWFYGRSISGEIKVEKSSRVLVFRDQVAKKEPEYIMEIKILSTKMRTRERPDTLGRFCVQILQEKRFTEYKERKSSNLYRFDSDLTFSFRTRPKHLKLTLCETNKVNAQLDHLNDQRHVSSISINDKDEPVRAPEQQAFSIGNMVDLTHFEDEDQRFGTYRSMQTPEQLCRQVSNIPNYDSDRLNDLEEDFLRSQPSSSSEEGDVDASRLLQTTLSGSACKLGQVKIRVPSKIWAQSRNDQRHFDGILSLGPNCLPHATASSYTSGYNAGQPAYTGPLYGVATSNDSHWWALVDPESGDIIGEVQLAFKFRRTFVPAASIASDFFNISVTIPSIGVSFLHNSTPNQSMLEVAFLSLQRMSLLYSCVNGQNSEVVFRLGNLQMDNQMDAEVVVGPKVQEANRGVSIRLRDRMKACWDYRYRGVLNNDNGTLQQSKPFKIPSDVVHFRMLWNAQCVAGDITHYELIQLAIQELEMSTDEKFIVNLIIVFQGLEILTQQHSFDEIVNSEINFVDEKAALAAAYVANLASRGLANTMLEYENQKNSDDVMRRRKRDADTEAAAISKLASLNPTNQSIYVEELQIDGIRIQFSVELNGGRYIRTLGSVGRRLAAYFPESNVKDLGLNLPKATFSHIYNSQATIIRSLLYHYRHHAVLVVVRGLHTVSLYANPLRICYRFLHGIIELIRLPLRGLMSGSPIEFLNGAYLGVRGLVMNLISGGYEIVAGAAGLLTIFVVLILPESKRRAFEEDMFAFQRSVMEEVDAFDAQEERAMVKTIVRQPRKFDSGNIGLLTVYGPGALPIEEQSRIDYNAALMIQEWWRRRRLAERLMEHVSELDPDFETITEEKSIKTKTWKECIIL
uniref:Uncharacterized protein AlNc14C135G7058 n=1 Tax=Albugo laibachii Nc14 TaxID=890382 RepID=F0W6G4_9STRA|nr:conserved hypothetical protein [Albugo laibachii Nc14]CCA21815.1 conserved hypothetical protein [Albugo laibachii Nc14]|eukprot:CCA21815.1 conserved hypothetical protein [Albugo laibachii Nc14]